MKNVEPRIPRLELFALARAPICVSVKMTGLTRD